MVAPLSLDIASSLSVTYNSCYTFAGPAGFGSPLTSTTTNGPYDAMSCYSYCANDGDWSAFAVGFGVGGTDFCGCANSPSAFASAQATDGDCSAACASGGDQTCGGNAGSNSFLQVYTVTPVQNTASSCGANHVSCPVVFGDLGGNGTWTCPNNTCVATCSTNYTISGSANMTSQTGTVNCWNNATDVLHCGGNFRDCAASFPAVDHGSYVCNNGLCAVQCEAGATMTGSLDQQALTSNVACMPTNQGTSCGTSHTNCSSVFGPITGGFYGCSSGTCTASCNAGFTRSGRLNYATNTSTVTCTNYNSDVHHCGYNNYDCAQTFGAAPVGSAYVCTSGTCSITCAANLIQIGDMQYDQQTNNVSCINLATDSSNCGALGATCASKYGALSNATYTCANSTCDYTCSGSLVKNGTLVNTIVNGTTSNNAHCLDLSQDALNCGALGLQCSSRFPALSNGHYYCAANQCQVQCATGLALTGSLYYNNFSSSAVCVNTTVDINNCGAAGFKCSKSVAPGSETVTCANSTCVATSCDRLHYLDTTNQICVKDQIAIPATISFGIKAAPYTAKALLAGCFASVSASNSSSVIALSGHVSSVEACASQCAVKFNGTSATSIYSIMTGGTNCTCSTVASILPSATIDSTLCNSPCYSSPAFAGANAIAESCGGDSGVSIAYFQYTGATTDSNQPVCSGGQCSVTKTQNDPLNCGIIGFSCATFFPQIFGGAYACQAGKCVASCSGGLTIGAATQNGSASASATAGAQCYDLTSDAANCGAIGHVCSFANSTQSTCMAGVCMATSCASGYVLKNNACVFGTTTTSTFVAGALTFTYNGCIRDSQSRTLPTRLDNVGGSISTCLNAAASAGFAYAGVENGNECWATNTRPYTINLPDSSCSIPCENDNTAFCGGAWALSFYTSNVKNLASIVTTSGATFKYLSCFGEPLPHALNNRALPVQLAKSGATPESCIALASARGYAFAGLEYGGECFASYNWPSGGQIADSYCSMPCNADNSRSCGGDWALSLYISSEAPKVRSIQGSIWNRHSCWGEPMPHGQQRSLANPIQIGNGKMTIEACLNAGSQYKYCGLEYSSQCWCDNAVFGGEIADSYCAKTCEGNADQSCGGDWALDLWVKQ